MSKETLIDRRKMRQPDRRENANSTRIAGDRSVREPDLETGRVFVFHDDDDGYLAWLASNARGWLVDANAAPGRDDLVLHRASCWTVTGSPAKGTTQITGPSWTGAMQVKACSVDVASLRRWALGESDHDLTACGHCASYAVSASRPVTLR